MKQKKNQKTQKPKIPNITQSNNINRTQWNNLPLGAKKNAEKKVYNFNQEREKKSELYTTKSKQNPRNQTTRYTVKKMK